MIEVRELSKRYGGKTAVDALTFTVKPGVVTGFLGPNGAGKSTTMRMMLGLSRPDSGPATVNGRSFTEHRRAMHEAGALLDAHAAHRGRSSYNHLLSLAQSNRIPRRRVGQVLELVGLTGVADRRVGAFSLGMAQRLGIAAALLGDPPVLICDEPINGLDPEGILWMRTLLRGLAAEGRTVLVSSHLMSEMALTADHLVVIGRGRLLADAGVREFIEGGARSSVLVRSSDQARLAPLLEHAGAVVRRADPTGGGGGGGEPALVITGLAAAEIGELAVRHGVVPHELATQHASLEAAYLELTRDAVDYRAETALDVGPAAESAIDNREGARA
ncbi:MAG TPA: ATP-binding cassette domain-containing protein [Actinocrinis sp.]|nr:ATP-binding cassette domain-containing protein [Actinocrinis sp.]